MVKYLITVLEEPAEPLMKKLEEEFKRKEIENKKLEESKKAKMVNALMEKAGLPPVKIFFTWKKTSDNQYYFELVQTGAGSMKQNVLDKAVGGLHDLGNLEIKGAVTGRIIKKNKGLF